MGSRGRNFCPLALGGGVVIDKFKCVIDAPYGTALAVSKRN